MRNLHDDIASVLIDQPALQNRIQALAAEIEADYATRMTCCSSAS